MLCLFHDFGVGRGVGALQISIIIIIIILQQCCNRQTIRFLCFAVVLNYHYVQNRDKRTTYLSAHQPKGDGLKRSEKTPLVLFHRLRAWFSQNIGIKSLVRLS